MSLKQLLINHIRKVFNTTFIENIKIKKLLKKLITLLFFHKMFLKIIHKPISLEHSSIFSIKYYYHVTVPIYTRKLIELDERINNAHF